MEIAEVKQYREFLKSAIAGAKVRAFFLGWGSETLEKYLQSRREMDWDFHERAFEQKVPISDRTNSNLSAKLFGLEVKASMARYAYA